MSWHSALDDGPQRPHDCCRASSTSQKSHVRQAFRQAVQVLPGEFSVFYLDILVYVVMLVLDEFYDLYAWDVLVILVSVDDLCVLVHVLTCF